MGRQWVSTALAVLIVLLTVGTAVLFNLESHDLEQLVDAYRQHHEKYVIATRMRQSTNDLTRLARTYAITGDKKFFEQYLQILETRNGEIAEPEHYDWVYWDYFAVDGATPPERPKTAISYDEVIKRGNLNEKEQQLLLESRQKSDELSNFEKSILAEGTWPKGSTSFSQLFDANYHRRKLDILARVNDVFRSLEYRAKLNVISNEKAFSEKRKLQFWLYYALVLTGALWMLSLYRTKLNAIAELDRKVAERTLSLKESKQQLETAVDKIRTLEGLLPICAYCHNIHDEDGNWCRIEDYISMRSEARFTHGMCPTCYHREMAKFRSTTS